MKFEYPTKDIDDDRVSGSLGGKNGFGFFPIGRFNSWHGGIHLGDLNESMHAIADGNVIAYRLPKDYSKETIGTDTYKYSDGFVLIQHFYKSPKGQELTFYSLYMHLLPYEQITKQKFLTPVIFTKRSGKINGLNARESTDFNVVRFVLPKGQVVTIDTSLTAAEHSRDHWSKSEANKNYKFRKVTFTDLNGASHSDVYIGTADKYVTKLSETTYQTKVEGSNDDPPEAYTFNVKSDKFDKVVTCNIPIKAGSLIGYTGLYEFERQKNYACTHLEVFTPEDVSSFIEDRKGDGEKTKNFVKLKVGDVLNKAYPGFIPKDSEVKVVDGSPYSTVQIQSMTKTVLRTDLKLNGKNSSNQDIYVPLGASLGKLNKEFGGLLKSDTTLIRLESLEEGGVQKRKVRVDLSDAKLFYAAPGDIVPRRGLEIRAITSDLIEIFESEPTLDKFTDTVEKEALISTKDLRSTKDPDGVLWYFINKDNKNGWIKASAVEISAYNWKAFGFEIIKDQADDFLYDAKAPSNFLKKLSTYIDTDGNKFLTSLELQRAFGDATIARKLSQLICYHTSEWDWAKRSAQFKAKVKELYEEGIDMEEDGALKKQLKEKRDATLDALDKRLTNLAFWPQVTNVPASAQTNAVPKEESHSYAPTYTYGGMPPEAREAIARAGVEIVEEITETTTSLWNWITGTKPVEKKTVPAKTSNTQAASQPKPQPKREPGKPGVFPAGDAKVYHFHPIAFVEQMRRLDPGICVCEARVRAFLRMLRVGEGTVGIMGYETNCGGKSFIKDYKKDWSDHPNVSVKLPNLGISSDAAGAYQVMGYTWNDTRMTKKRKQYNITDFSPENQDLFAIILLKYARPGLINLIIEGNIQKGLEDKASYEWASLPPGRYGQPAKTMDQALNYYQNYLKAELIGDSDLYLKNGFLAKFNIHCC